MIDQFSKYAEAHHIKTSSGKEVIKTLEKVFSRNPYPNKIIADSGKEFDNELVKEYCKVNNIKIHYTSIDNPKSNSPVERLHSTICEHIQILNLSPSPKHYVIKNKMKLAIKAYNNTIHSVTKMSPLQILFGNKSTLKDPANVAKSDIIKDYLDEKREINKLIKDRIEGKKKQVGEENPKILPTDIYLKKKKRTKKGTQNFQKIKLSKYNKKLGRITDIKKNKYRINRIKRPRLFQDNDDNPNHPTNLDSDHND